MLIAILLQSKSKNYQFKLKKSIVIEKTTTLELTKMNHD